ncbi:MAG: LEA type 2 family protein [Vicinamibacteria bacterium]
MKSLLRSFLFVGMALFLSACASMKPPAVRIAGLRLDGVSLTGARIDVGLNIRNVNSEDLNIERFEYVVKVNGRVLGRGFQSDPLVLRGFAEDKVTSRLEVNLLRLPGVVKDVLDRDRVNARVNGTFYVRQGSGIRKVKFGTEGEVDLNRDRSRDRR